MEEEEITKELKTIDEIELIPIEEEKEETPETTPSKEEKKEEEEKQKKLNKIWLIGGIVIALLLIVFVIIFLIPGGKKEDNTKKVTSSNDSKFVAKIKKSIASGEFDQAIKEGLKENGVSAKKVCITRMDIDSDGDQDLAVLADGDKKILLQLDVEEAITYEDSFELDAKDAIGYVYSSEKDENYWYTEYNKNYTIISSAKKIIKEEDFIKNYFALTKTYKQKPILDNCVEYKFNQELDAKAIEENTIKAKDVLKDNNIKEEEIKEAYKKYVTEEEEKEKKEKEEQEAKKKEEEMERKLSGSFTLGSGSYQYGTYKLYNEDEENEGAMVLYSDGTCTYKDASCKYQIGEVRKEDDELVPGLALDNGKTFVSSSKPGELLAPHDKLTARYSG